MLEFFVIKPKQALLDVMGQPPILGFHLPKLWKAELGDRNSPEDNLWVVKSIYMINLISMRDMDTAPPPELRKIDEFRARLAGKSLDEFAPKPKWKTVGELLEQLFGAPPYKITDFDRWWTIERVFLGFILAEVIERSSKSDMDLFAPTGMAWLDEWLEVLREWKDQGTASSPNAANNANSSNVET